MTIRGCFGQFGRSGRSGRLSVALRAARLLPIALVIEIGLRLGKPSELARLLGVALIEGATTTTSSLIELSDPRVVAQVRAVRLVFRRTPLPSTCLRRALLTAWALRSLDPVVVIGVKVDGDRFEAHSWVRIGDVVIDPPNVSSEFAPLSLVNPLVNRPTDDQ